MIAGRILLTGATGFVGARVARDLVDRGASVVAIVRQSSSLARLQDLKGRITFATADYRDAVAIRGLMVKYRPEGLIHLAWAGVKGAERNSLAQADNVVASLDLYRSARAAGCTAFVGLGSQAEYGPACGRLNEHAPTRPTTVYGSAKLATGVLLERMAATEGATLAWLRLFSSYGPGDDPSWMIQYVARKLLAGERPSLTAAEQIWDYIYVDDVSSAIVSALEKRVHGTFNLGSGVPIELRKVLFQLRDLVDPGLELGFGEVPYRSDQVMHLEADISSLSAATGWHPKVGLRDGLRSVVEWLKTH